MPNDELAIIGLTRFSVDPACIIEPGRERKPLKELRAAIYNPVRLRQHFKLFKAFCLPSMAAAASRHPAFRHVVLVSPTLPRYYLWWLQAFRLRHAGWLHLRMVRPGDDLLEVMRRAISELAQGKGRVFNFRLDDDDALKPDFTDKVVELSRTCDDDKVVSFDRGLYVQRINSAMFRVHDKVYPNIACGLGQFCSSRAPSSIFEGGVHNRIAADRVVNVKDGPYWIRTLHAHNDSGSRTEDVPAITLAEACGRLASAFPHLDVKRALRALPATGGIGADAGAVRALFHIQ